MINQIIRVERVILLKLRLILLSAGLLDFILVDLDLAEAEHMVLEFGVAEIRVCGGYVICGGLQQVFVGPSRILVGNVVELGKLVVPDLLTLVRLLLLVLVQLGSR